MSGKLRAWALIGYLSSFLGAVLPVVFILSQGHMSSAAPLRINLAAFGPGLLWLVIHSFAFLVVLFALGRALRKGEISKLALRVLLAISLALVVVSLIPGSTLGSLLLFPAIGTFASLLVLSR